MKAYRERIARCVHRGGYKYHVNVSDKRLVWEAIEKAYGVACEIPFFDILEIKTGSSIIRTVKGSPVIYFLCQNDKANDQLLLFEKILTCNER